MTSTNFASFIGRISYDTYRVPTLFHYFRYRTEPVCTVHFRWTHVEFFDLSCSLLVKIVVIHTLSLNHGLFI
jgi:hypothetical protein